MTEEIATVDFAGIIENPKKLMQNANALAKEFNKIVDGQKLFTLISGKKHVHVDAWSMMGVLLGVFPQVESTERVDKGGTFKAGAKEVEEITYKAVVSLCTMQGTRITKVEIICSNKEKGKAFNDEYSIQSMAETRGVGKAFRMSFGWIARMAGYDSTPFEEAEGIYRDTIKPPAPITVMNDLKKAIEKAKTMEEYRAACDSIQKYGAQLNDADVKEIREFAKAKLKSFKEPEEEPVKEKEEETPSEKK